MDLWGNTLGSFFRIEIHQSQFEFKSQGSTVVIDVTANNAWIPTLFSREHQSFHHTFIFWKGKVNFIVLEPVRTSYYCKLSVILKILQLDIIHFQFNYANTNWSLDIAISCHKRCDGNVYYTCSLILWRGKPLLKDRFELSCVFFNWSAVYMWGKLRVVNLFYS